MCVSAVCGQKRSMALRSEDKHAKALNKSLNPPCVTSTAYWYEFGGRLTHCSWQQPAVMPALIVRLFFSLTCCYPGTGDVPHCVSSADQVLWPSALSKGQQLWWRELNLPHSAKLLVKRVFTQNTATQKNPPRSHVPASLCRVCAVFPLIQLPLPLTDSGSSLFVLV